MTLMRPASGLKRLFAGAAALFAAGLFVSPFAFGQGRDLVTDPTFAVSPEVSAFAGDAAAVVRLSHEHFSVSGPGRATSRIRRAVTVFKETGRGEGQVVLYYDKLHRVRGLEGQIRDASGKTVRKLKRGEIRDISAVSDISLYDDNRVMVAELYHEVYPYTIEYEYEVEYVGLLFWPTFYFQPDTYPVEIAALDLDAPEAMAVRHMVHGAQLAPEERRERGRQSYRWILGNLPEREPEPFSPPLTDQAPVVYTGPVEFEIEGTRGDMSSWERFGQWYAGLAEGRGVLPPETFQHVRQLVAGAPSDLEKVRRIYEYLQETTRYVSIQLGLGGWQPFPATYVAGRGYGDCKALVNYMQALLKAAGITAYPALIRSGANQPEVIEAFPTPRFNHVVLFVPVGADTVWLECTSQTMPFGRLGRNNEDRYALVVRPGGGELVRTPRSAASDNRQLRTGRILVSENGDARAEVRTVYSGTQQDYVRGNLAQASPRERDEWLRDDISIPAFELVSADFSGVESRSEEVALPVTLQLNKYASRSGERLFVRPNLMERWVAPPRAVENRTLPVVFGSTYADTDTLLYELPAGFVLEAAPAPVKLETPFSRYESSATVGEDGRLVYTRYLEINQTRLPAEQYVLYRDFMSAVSRADNAQIVLVRKKT